MTKIEIDGDNVVVTWTGKKGRGSLLQIMAEGNAKKVNTLDMIQCLAVIICVRNVPFPCGDGERLFRKALEFIPTQTAMVEAGEKMGLGAVRKALVEKAGGGCNAPTDSYIDLAAKVVLEMTPA
jgi:hypothetical protein